jgi:tRNA-modifying protein YgfZ
MNVDTSTDTVTDRAYQALREGALVADRSDRLRMTFTGAKAAESLTGLVTNDVVSLTPGRGQYAAALTNKGKILADVRIFARINDFLVDASAMAGQQWAAMIRKFVNPRLARYQDISAQTGDVGVFGPKSREIVNAVLRADLVSDLAPYSHVTAALGDASLMIARVPDFGVEGYDIIGPREVVETLTERFLAAGAIEGTSGALHIARVEAGRPEWGVDMDESILAQEMDMDRLDAISFTKGCYTGQETVARVHYRGHVNRLLRGIRFSSSVVPPAGTPLFDASRKEVGQVKSGALSPQHGAIALALLRREVEPGSTVTANWSSERANARVEELPFAG